MDGQTELFFVGNTQGCRRVCEEPVLRSLPVTWNKRSKSLFAY